MVGLGSVLLMGFANLPILMILLFGFGITTEIKNARFAVYDPSHDIATQKIIEKIQTSEYFSLEAYINDPGEIETIFQEGKISLKKYYEGTGESSLFQLKGYSIKYEAIRKNKFYQSLKA